MRVRINVEDSKGEGEGMRTTACMYVTLCVGRGLGKGMTLLCAVIVMRWRREGW